MDKMKLHEVVESFVSEEAIRVIAGWLGGSFRSVMTCGEAECLEITIPSTKKGLSYVLRFSHEGEKQRVSTDVLVYISDVSWGSLSCEFKNVTRLSIIGPWLSIETADGGQIIINKWEKKVGKWQKGDGFSIACRPYRASPRIPCRHQV